MAKKIEKGKKLELKLSDVLKKDLKLVGYLLASGLGGWLLAKYVAGNQELTVLFAPAINYVLYRLEQELDANGYSYKKALSGGK